MCKIILGILLSLFASVVSAQDGEKLDQFWRIYSEWALTHSEYECEMSPDTVVSHSALRLWQVKTESGEVDNILRINSDRPISHEAYIFLTDSRDQVMYFPETNRTILIYASQDLSPILTEDSLGVAGLPDNLELLKKFLIFEELTEIDGAIIFEMILDVKKMESEGVIPSRSGVGQLRLIYSLDEKGQPVRLSRQFDDNALETLHFNYITFSSEEVHASFPKIEDRSSASITPDFTIKDALEEIEKSREES